MSVARHGDAFVLPRAHDARRLSEQQVARRLARERSSFYGLRIQGKGITFVLDGSDSMRSAHQLPTVGADGVTLLENLGDEVAAALTRLEDGQLFNLIFFGTSLERFAPRLVKLGATNRGEATRFVRRTTTLGATDLRAALEAAFEDPGTDTILLVTDGAGLSLLEQDRLLSSVRKWNRRREVVIHGIDLGFGGVPEVSTLFKLSELTGGTFRSSPPLHQRDR